MKFAGISYSYPQREKGYKLKAKDEEIKGGKYSGAAEGMDNSFEDAGDI